MPVTLDQPSHVILTQTPVATLCSFELNQYHTFHLLSHTWCLDLSTAQLIAAVNAVKFAVAPKLLGDATPAPLALELLRSTGAVRLNDRIRTPLNYSRLPLWIFLLTIAAAVPSSVQPAGPKTGIRPFQASLQPFWIVASATANPIQPQSQAPKQYPNHHHDLHLILGLATVLPYLSLC